MILTEVLMALLQQPSRVLKYTAIVAASLQDWESKQRTGKDPQFNQYKGKKIL